MIMPYSLVRSNLLIRCSNVLFLSLPFLPHVAIMYSLIHLATQVGKGPEINEALLRATYEEGKNVSDIATLIDVGEELGLQNIRNHLVRSA